MLDAYHAHVAERQALGIPPLALDASQVRTLCDLLMQPGDADGEELLYLLRERVPPGVADAAKIKADWLDMIVRGGCSSPLVDGEQAIALLGGMVGGYCVGYLVAALHNDHAVAAAAALSRMIMVFGHRQAVERLAAQGNPQARVVLEAWAEARWFVDQPTTERISGVVYKISGETNTDDLSPATHASTRPDIPLHALAMYESRDPACVPWLQARRAAGERVIMVGDVFGTGSSRKSATNSLLWWIGDDIPNIPNKRQGGVLLARSIAPIFANTMRDAGGLPLEANVDDLHTGDHITIDLETGQVRRQDQAVTTARISPAAVRDEHRVGGRINLLIGRALTDAARTALGQEPATVFAPTPAPPPVAGGFTLAQKLVGRACGLPGVVPGTVCQPRITTVASQDTTGPMTADEMRSLACLDFGADLVMQSFCHTAAYPKPVDVAMHGWLADFIAERGGLALRPGDGVIHSWVNRMLLPDTVGTGGDSHTRFPLGISFPAGSGLVAFAATLGTMPLDMPESVLVRFVGQRREGITLRDLVNAIPAAALAEGSLVLGKSNVFAGRILEMEGLDDLDVDQAFELTDASAERSAAAATIALPQAAVEDHVRSCIALLNGMLSDGYRSRETIERRVQAMSDWLAAPQLLRRDEDAVFAHSLTIDLDAITEPLVCCPNDPDKIAPLSQVAGTPVDEVFVGSCMVNLDHFRTLARVIADPDVAYVRPVTWVCPPTRMDREQLRSEGLYGVLGAKGCRLEIPGCSLCMGNQARVRQGATVFSTSTRNFNNRMGTGAQVYLGSTALAAMVAVLGHIPSLEEYRHWYGRCIASC